MDHAKIEMINGRERHLRGGGTSVAMHPLLSWRAVFAGLLIALFSYVILIALGVGVGGISLSDGLETGIKGAGYWTAGWIIVANALALFIGAFFAARVARSPARLVGGTQALVISALFFGVVSLQAAASLGIASQALGSMVGNVDESLAAFHQSALESPEMEDIMETALEDLNLESHPEVVVQGLAIRLIAGETDRARDYLARQSGITMEDAQIRVDQAKAEVDAALSRARETGAKTLAAAGLALFAIMLTGAFAGVFGGVVGARRNLQRPVHDEDIVLVDRAA